MGEARRKRQHQQDGIRQMESLDNFSGLRNGLRAVAALNREWAGIPMPLENVSLVVEPTYPKALELMAISSEPRELDELPEDSDLVGARERNRFYSMQRRAHVVIFELRDGRIEWGLSHGRHSLDLVLQTLAVQEAWGIEQEANAVKLLGELVKHRQFKQYMLTGTFLETSDRSGVVYLFRRLRPTIAMTVRGGTMKRRGRGGIQILCTLCLHPIAYYSGSFGGAMCPTDDVIAHLMLMRGDEAMFWRRANQHAAWEPESHIL